MLENYEDIVLKITEVKAIYPRYRVLPSAWRQHFWQIAVRIDTDAGVSGWGYGGGGVAAVDVVNLHLRELLVGRTLGSIEDIADLWDAQYQASLPYGRSGIAVMAISGVDLALWDVLGRAEGQRVCDLLGGQRRNAVRAYATGPDYSWYRDLGFDAHKSSQTRQASPEADTERILEWADAARQGLGDEALLMIDAYMSWTPEFALSLTRQLSQHNIYWFEDVLLPDDLDGLAALRPQIQPVLLAGGEHEFTARDFTHIARAQALDLWQPDITWCGGLTAALRIAELAEQYNVPLVPHRGGEIWGLHFLAAGYGEDLAEKVMGKREAKRDELWLGEPASQDGCLILPEGPGFGVEINEELL